MGRGGLAPEFFLVAGGLMIGAGLFLGSYVSLEMPLASVLTVLFLASGVLFSEAMFSNKPYFYVMASALLAITTGCCLLSFSYLLVPTGACSLLGPILVARGLREFRSKAARP